MVLCVKAPAQWGEAGDWRREADRIYEIRFGSADQLTR
jgi:hypothetical protein